LREGHAVLDNRAVIRSAVLVAATIAVVVAVAFLAPHAPVASDYSSQHLHDSHGAGAPMTEEAMQRWVREFYESNPVVGVTATNGVAPAATFQSINYKFDSDGDFAGTPIDTAEVMMGDMVRWQRLVGVHTVTNGTGAADPDVATLFDVPHDAANPVFDFVFTEAGLFPFFCRPHETLQMVGAVRVIDPATPTRSTTWGEIKARNR